MPQPSVIESPRNTTRTSLAAAGGRDLSASRNFARKAQSLYIRSSCDFWYGVNFTQAASAGSAGFASCPLTAVAVACEKTGGPHPNSATLRQPPNSAHERILFLSTE